MLGEAQSLMTVPAYGDVLIEGDLAFRLRDQPAQLLEGHLAGLRRTARDTLIGCEIGCVIFAPVVLKSEPEPRRARLEFLVVGDPEPEIFEILGVADAVGPRLGQRNSRRKRPSSRFFLDSGMLVSIATESIVLTDEYCFPMYLNSRSGVVPYCIR